MVEWPDRSHSSVERHMTTCLEFVKRHLKTFRVKILWSGETKIELFGLNAKHVEDTWHHPYGEAWWCQHHAVGCFLAAGTERLVRIETKMNVAKYREILDENLIQSAQDLRLGRKFTFQKHNDPMNTPKTMHEWLWDKSLNVLEWPSQRPDLKPIEHFCRDLKIAV